MFSSSALKILPGEVLEHVVDIIFKEQEAAVAARFMKHARNVMRPILASPGIHWEPSPCFLTCKFSRVKFTLLIWVFGEVAMRQCVKSVGNTRCSLDGGLGRWNQAGAQGGDDSWKRQASTWKGGSLGVLTGRKERVSRIMTPCLTCSWVNI